MLFGKLNYSNAYHATLLSLRQTGVECVVASAARKFDFCFCPYPNFATENQLSRAINDFIFGISNVYNFDLQRERARRKIDFQEAVMIVHASIAARVLESDYLIAAAMMISNTNNEIATYALMQNL